MDSLKPAEIVDAMISAGAARTELGVCDLLIRGGLSGMLLGISTTLALTAAAQTGVAFVGALIFPVGFVMIVLLGLDLVTGSFALVPMAAMAGRARWSTVAGNLAWAFLGNLIGSVLYAVLFVITITDAGLLPATTGIAQKLVQLAEANTTGYAAIGGAGMLTMFVKAILCNWMVCMGTAMGLASTSAIGRIIGAWLPVTVFFAQGFEHAVVNMFIIPAGMLMGAKVSFTDWWFWNQIPVTLGNIVGGFVFVGVALYVTYVPSRSRLASEALAASGD